MPACIVQSFRLYSGFPKVGPPSRCRLWIVVKSCV